MSPPVLEHHNRPYKYSLKKYVHNETENYWLKGTNKLWLPGRGINAVKYGSSVEPWRARLF